MQQLAKHASTKSRNVASPFALFLFVFTRHGGSNIFHAECDGVKISIYEPRSSSFSFSFSSQRARFYGTLELLPD